MKKLFVLLVLVLMAILTACSPGQDAPYSEAIDYEISGQDGLYSELGDCEISGQDAVNIEPIDSEVEFICKYMYTEIDEIMFSDPASLAESAEHVFIGAVESISFAVINNETGKAPTEYCSPIDLLLVTIYEVNVLAAYKGAQQSTVRVLAPGGMRGYREREQLSLTMEAGAVSYDGVYRAFINSHVRALEAGRAYLFVVLNLAIELDGYSNFVGIINSDQSFIDIASPFSSIDNFTDITVEGVIKSFGEAAFEEFMQNRAYFQSR